MILHLILNSLIIFVWMAIAIEFFLYSLKVTNSRIRYICRALPFLKLPFDLLIFMFYGDSLFINLNPLSCEINTYELLSKLFPQMTQISSLNEHVIIPQYIATQISTFWLDCLTITVILIAIGGTVCKFYKLLLSRKYLKNIIDSSTLFKKIILNKTLQEHLQGCKAEILISADIEIPFAANARYILLPQNMMKELSHEELEAVIAHELQHLRWKDPLCKLVCSIVCSLCWWIPTEWWLKRLIAEQEQASDAGIYHYGIDNYALATAVTKILYKAKNPEFDTTAICLLGSSKSTHLSRLKHILNGDAGTLNKSYVFKGVVAIILCLFTFISLWMC